MYIGSRCVTEVAHTADKNSKIRCKISQGCRSKMVDREPCGLGCLCFIQTPDGVCVSS